MAGSGRYNSDYLTIVHPLAVIAWEWESQNIDKRSRSEVPSDCVFFGRGPGVAAEGPPVRPTDSWIATFN